MDIEFLAFPIAAVVTEFVFPLIPDLGQCTPDSLAQFRCLDRFYRFREPEFLFGNGTRNPSPLVHLVLTDFCAEDRNTLGRSKLKQSMNVVPPMKERMLGMIEVRCLNDEAILTMCPMRTAIDEV